MYLASILGHGLPAIVGPRLGVFETSTEYNITKRLTIMMRELEGS